MPYINDLEKLQLRVGDKVKYVGKQTANLIGMEGTVKALAGTARCAVAYENKSGRPETCYPYNRNLALWIPDYQPGDIVRITPRDGTLNSYEGDEGVVESVDNFEEDGRYRVYVCIKGRRLQIAPFARNLTLLVAADAADTFEVSDIVRVGGEVCVLRALPDEPNGLHEVEAMNGDTLFVTGTAMEKLT